MFCRAVVLFGLFAILANLLLVSATPIPDVEVAGVEKRICMRSCKYVEGASAPFVTSTTLASILPEATESAAASSLEHIPAPASSVPASVETPAAAATPESVAPPMVTYAAAFPQYAKTNGASTRGPAGALVIAVTAASTLFFAL